MLIFDRIFSIDDDEARIRRLLAIENISIPIFSLLIVVNVAYFGLWGSEFVQIWSNILLVTIILGVATLQSGMRGSPNPVFKQVGNTTHFFLPPFFAIIVIGNTRPGVINAITLKVSLLGAAFFLILLSWWTGNLRRLPAMSEKAVEYKKLSEKQDSLEDKLDNLQYLAGAIGDEDMRSEIEKAVDIVNECCNKSRYCIESKKFEKSRAYLTQAETEVEEIRSIFENQIRLSLEDELLSRLDQAELEIENIEEELENSNIKSQISGRIRQDVDDAREEVKNTHLNEMSISDEEVPGIIRIINNIFSSIRDIRTALRFKNNVSSSIDEMQEEIEEEYEVAVLAKNLGIDVENIETKKSELVNKLENFRSGVVSSPSVLVNRYREIQRIFAEYSSEIDALWLDIQKEWEKIELLDNTYAFVPKSCKTNRAKRGAVTTERIGSKYKVNGTLLESPSNDIVEASQVDETGIGIGSFDVAGKGGGIGHLYIECLDNSCEKEHEIRIVPGILKITQQSFGFAPVVAGISVALLWLAGINLRMAAPVALAIGGMVSIIVFLVQYLRLRKNISNSFLDFIQRKLSHLWTIR